MPGIEKSFARGTTLWGYEMENDSKPPRKQPRSTRYLEGNRDRKSQRTMRERVAYCLLGAFIFTTLCVMALIYLNGFGLTTVPNNIIYTLIVETIGNGIAMFLSVTNWLFRNNK
jgi:O-antigen/teichoic acid export membrane protein